MPDLTLPARLRGLLLGTLCLGAFTAQAGEALISARVENERVIDVTPRSRVCQQWQLCTTTQTIDLPFEYSKDINLTSTNAREKVYVHLPSRQAILLVNRETQETASAKLAFRYISQKVSHQTQPVLSTGVTGGCTAPSGLVGASNYKRYLWSTFYPDGQRPCMATATGTSEVQHSTFNETMLSYTADFPAAASLSPGLWEGFIDYPVGQPGGFDFGDLVQVSADSIRFRMEINVKHDMQVDFPASGSAIEVIPPGGWKQYETSNQIPPRLVHDSPLKIWASSPFAVYVTCQYGNNLPNCGMKHPSVSDLAAVHTALTLPATFHYNGQPVTRLPLGVGAANAKLITPVGNVSSQPGQVHFEVQQNDIRRMLAYFRGATYSGDVTLMFDANF